jgi:ABC-2 type transport system ATP-binding protein
VPVGARLLLVSQPEASAPLLLGILAGLVRARRGRFEVAGLRRSDDSPQGWRRRVAYVPPHGGFYPWLSPLEVLDLAARLAGFDRAERRRRVEAAIEHYRLGPVMRRAASRGGPGTLQRTGLAAGLIGDPDVLLLEDPLRAVDDAERARLLALPGDRLTVLLSSMRPESEDGLVDQLVLLRAGRLAVHARRRELSQRELPLSMHGIAALADGAGAASPAAAGA